MLDIITLLLRIIIIIGGDWTDVTYPIERLRMHRIEEF